jgi:hypothetical protein
MPIRKIFARPASPSKARTSSLGGARASFISLFPLAGIVTMKGSGSRIQDILRLKPDRLLERTTDR